MIFKTPEMIPSVQGDYPFMNTLGNVDFLLYLASASELVCKKFVGAKYHSSDARHRRVFIPGCLGSLVYWHEEDLL
jgi:hypothetical protein